MTLDFRIDNARLFDGYAFVDQQRIGVANGIIVLIGDEAAPARKIIDGTGKLVTPAFVDTHSHADFLVSHEDNDGGSAISQGVGTIIVGNCGMSSTPPTAPFPLLLNKEDDVNLACRDHLEKVRSGLSLNIGELIGHNTLRVSVLGAPRVATRSEIASMGAMLREFLSDGWVGMSVGLNYPEASGYHRNELFELCKILAEFDRPLTCHIRDQGAGILTAIDEVIDVSAEAGCRVLLSHLRPLSGGIDHLVPEIERRFDEHDHAHFDLYPYVAGCTTLSLIFQSSFHSVPDPSSPFASSEVNTLIGTLCMNSYKDIHVIRHSNDSYLNETIERIAIRLGHEPSQVVQRVYFDDPNCICIFDNTSTQEDVDRLIQHERCLFGSDSWLYPTHYEGACHPRNFGAFTRFLTRYVRNGPIDLVSGLRRITSEAADYFGVDAGHIEVGKRANIALFAMDNLRERADFEHPYRMSGGMEGVWIGGYRVFDGSTIDAHHRPGVRLHVNSAPNQHS